MKINLKISFNFLFDFKLSILSVNDGCKVVCDHTTLSMSECSKVPLDLVMDLTLKQQNNVKIYLWDFISTKQTLHKQNGPIMM